VLQKAAFGPPFVSGNSERQWRKLPYIQEDNKMEIQFAK